MRVLLLLLKKCLTWHPLHARRREARLVQHRTLSQAFRQHIQEAQVTTIVDWDTWDRPWVQLLEAWLADPDPGAGLQDLAHHYTSAWRTSASLPGRPAMTPVGHWVKQRWASQVPPPIEAMQMALQSNRGFLYALWEWALRQSSGEGIPLAIAALRANGHSTNWALVAAMITTVSPEVSAATFDALWDTLRESEQVSLLSTWVSLWDLPSGQWVAHAARRPSVLRTNCLKAWVPDAWHQGLLNTVEEGIEGRVSLPQVIRVLGEWQRHWPSSHEGVLKQELCHIWDRSLWNQGQVPEHEQRLVERLDGLTSALAPMVPMHWWTDPDFWGTRAPLPLTWATTRQAKALLNDQAPLSSPRSRGRS